MAGVERCSAETSPRGRQSTDVVVVDGETAAVIAVKAADARRVLLLMGRTVQLFAAVLRKL